MVDDLSLRRHPEGADDGAAVSAAEAVERLQGQIVLPSEKAPHHERAVAVPHLRFVFPVMGSFVFSFARSAVIELCHCCPY